MSVLSGELTAEKLPKRVWSAVAHLSFTCPSHADQRRAAAVIALRSRSASTRQKSWRAPLTRVTGICSQYSALRSGSKSSADVQLLDLGAGLGGDPAHHGPGVVAQVAA